MRTASPFFGNSRSPVAGECGRVIDRAAVCGYTAFRMLHRVQTVAPAKINLGLEVFPRRADGYHDIAGIFTTVAVADRLTVCRSLKKGCSVSCPGMVLPPDNTIVRAYKAFCVLTGISEGVDVHLEKHIPAGGGLGGGSSDASSFIQSIDALFGTGLTAADKCALAAEVGSDVFFFTHALLSDCCGGRFAALVHGRGEHVVPVPARTDYTVLLVFPSAGVSTPEAYRLLDGRQAVRTERFPYTEAHPLVAEYRKPGAEWRFCNDFTGPVGSRYPEIQRALAAVRAAGADFTDMSGSGSTVYGIFVDPELARRAQQKLAGDWRAVLA